MGKKTAEQELYFSVRGGLISAGVLVRGLKRDVRKKWVRANFPGYGPGTRVCGATMPSGGREGPSRSERYAKATERCYDTTVGPMTHSGSRRPASRSLAVSLRRYSRQSP